MLITRVMPCLLVGNDRLVKTVKFKNPKYIGDPVNAIKIYNEKEVDELIILDITATIEKKTPNFNLISEIASEGFMPVCYGGGVSSIEQIKKLFGLGIEKVSLNSYVINNPNLITEAVKQFGNQSIVSSIDVKKNLFGKYQVYTHGGRINSRIHPIELAKLIENAGAGEILLNSIDQDGTWNGFDIKLIKSITESVNIPVIVAGGAGNIEDISHAIIEGRASAIALGSMAVYQGKDM